MFCSSECAEAAEETYHTHEEEGNGLYFAARNHDQDIVGEILFALKILFSFKPEELKKKVCVFLLTYSYIRSNDN